MLSVRTLSLIFTAEAARRRLPPSVSSASVSVDESSAETSTELYRTLRTKTSRSNTEFAVALQASLNRAEEVARNYELERVNFGAKQDRVFIAYWRGWEHYIHDAYEMNDRILEFFWQRSLIDDKLADFIDASADPLRWDSQRGQQEDPGRTDEEDGGAASGRSTYSTHCKPVELDPPPEEVSSLARGAHMVADVHRQMSRGLRRVSRQLRSDFFGVYGGTEPHENEKSKSEAEGSCATKKAKRQEVFLQSRPWKEPEKFAVKDNKRKGKSGDPRENGILVRMRNDYMQNVRHIINKGDEISSILKQVNQLCADAYHEFRDSVENLKVVVSCAVSQGNEASRQSSDPELSGTKTESRSGTVATSSTEMSQKATKFSGALIGDCTPEIFLAFLRYLRCVRCLLQTKRSFMQQMSTMFEEFREAEKKRDQAIQQAFDRYLKWMDQHHNVLGISCIGARETIKEIETHADFKVYINRYVQKYIKENISAEAEDSSENDIGAILRSEPTPIKSPLFSPLIYRWGKLQRRKGSVMQRWETVIAILTRTGVLYFFSEKDDLASSSKFLSSEECPQPEKLLSARGQGARLNNEESTSPEATSNCVEELGNEPALEMARKASNAPDIVFYVGKAMLSKSTKSSGKVILNFRPDVDKSAFEVGTVFSSMFVFSSTSKILLRAPSNDAMLDWMYDIETVANRSSAAVTLVTSTS